VNSSAITAAAKLMCFIECSLHSWSLFSSFGKPPLVAHNASRVQGQARTDELKVSFW